MDDDDFILPDGITLDTPLREVKEWMFGRIAAGAADKCPCCEKVAKLYERPITSTVAYSLIKMFRHAGTDWVRWKDLDIKQSDEAKARFWGIIEERPGERPDGSTRTGWWRLTPFGVRFIHGQETITRRARLYGAKFYGFVEGDPQVDVRDCLGNRFDYGKLMRDEL